MIIVYFRECNVGFKGNWSNIFYKKIMIYDINVL